MKINNPFSSQNIIGYISEVSAGELKVHFPNSKNLNRFYNNGKDFHGGIVGSYIVIEGETKGFLGKFVKVSLPEKERKSLTEEKYKNTELHPVGYVELLFSFDLLSYEPEKSINNFPSVGAKAYVTNSEFYISLLNKDKDEFKNDKLNIGEDLDTGEEVELSANKLFQRHCAIVGTTGGGKSYTVSKIIEELIKKEGAKILLLDPTGEFSSLDGIKNNKNKEIVKNHSFNNGTNSISFKSSDFVFDDFIALFRPAGQVQLPKLMEAIKSLKIVELKISINEVRKSEEESLKSPYNNNGCLVKQGCSEKLYNRFSVLKESNISKINFNIKKLGQQIYNECFYVNNEKWTNENDRDKGNCSSLVVRITNTIYDEIAKSIFNFENNISEGNIDVIDEINNFIKNDNLNLLRLDFSNISSEKSYKEILVNAIGRKLLDKAQEKERPFNEKPLIVFIDEAHLFLNKKIKDEYSIEVELNAFERIAKECRKYGLFLCIATQRPRDIPEGILSQMGTFIVHRLINDKDKGAIENAVSNYNKAFLNFLPSLGKGEALIMGVEFLTTLFLKIQKTNNPPNSNTPELFSKVNETDGIYKK